MKITDVFLIVIMCTVVLGSAFIILEIARINGGSAGHEIDCQRPEIRQGSSCCLDMNYNGICDSTDYYREQAIESNLKEIEATQKDMEIERLRVQNEAMMDRSRYHQMTEYPYRWRNPEYYHNDYREECYYNGAYYYCDRYISDYDDEWDLTVRAIDYDTDDYIEDAKVRIDDGDGETDYTDDEGEAKFYSLDEDCYDIRVSKSGYETEYESVCLTSDKRVTVYLRED